MCNGCGLFSLFLGLVFFFSYLFLNVDFMWVFRVVLVNDYDLLVGFGDGV